MKTSLIVNTACGQAQGGNPFRGGSYADRWEGLQRIVSESIGRFDEVVVAGVIPGGEDIECTRYVEVVGGYGDRRDALLQREVGARAATGDILIFTHDDHLPAFNGSDINDYESWDILVPERIHGATGKQLNNGRDAGYMGGHTLIMKRHVWVQIPWVAVVPDRCWDLPMTRVWQENGVRIAFSDILQSIDIEAQPDEV